MSLFAVVALLLVLNVHSASAFNATSVTLKISVPKDVSSVCYNGQCFNRSTSVTNYVTIGNRRFAMLNDTCPKAYPQPIPAGWRLALNTDADSMVFLRLKDTTGKWPNAYGVILATAGYNPPIGSSYVYTAATDSISSTGNQLYYTADHLSFSGTDASQCVLIVQDFPIPEYSKALVAQAHISTFITFAGYDYAVADNSLYNNTNAGVIDSSFLWLNSASEWQVAADEDASKAVIFSTQNPTSTWGANCLLVASAGVSNSFVAYGADLTVCAQSASAGITGTIAFNGGLIYKIASGAKNFKLLLRRASTLPNTWTTNSVITYSVSYGAGEYATLDNNGIDTPTKVISTRCQANPMTMPDGYVLATSAELSAFTAANKAWVPWTLAYCYVTSGGSYSPSNGTNGSCQNVMATFNVAGTTYYAPTQCGKVLIKKNLVAKTTFTIGMKILLISVLADPTKDVQLQLALTMFKATGTTYDWISLLDANNNPVYTDANSFKLKDDVTGNPLYYAIVSTDALYSYNTTRQMTQGQVNQLNDYIFTYGIRVVYLLSSPLAPACGCATQAGTGGSAVPGTFAALDATFISNNKGHLSGLNTAAGYDISGVYGNPMNVDKCNATVVLRYTTNETQSATSNDSVAAAIITSAGGIEEFHFFIANSVSFVHGPLLSSLWLNWMTRGAWVGSRRVYLGNQIDDLFLSTEAFDNQAIANRMTANDLTLTQSFFASLVSPPSSNITCEFGFNGNGVLIKSGTNTFQDPLYDAVKANLDNFFWESHTFTHEDFTCPDSDCADRGTTTAADVEYELTQNFLFAQNSLFAGSGGLSNPRYSPNCMITPAITGLFNPAAISTMLANGVLCVVGDNSVPALQPANYYLGEYTTVQLNNWAGLFIIPRAPTAIYYDVSQVVSELNEYNYRYGINGILNPPGTVTTNKTLDQILASEARVTCDNLFMYRHDPYMFHQANLVHFSYQKNGDTAAKQWSLFTLWVASVVEEYNKYMTLPIYSIRHQDLFQFYLDRRDREVCGISATLSVNNGAMAGVSVSTTGTCEAGITGLSSCGSASGCRTETYGSDSTVWVKFGTAGTTSLPLSGTW